jgi:hypothetical protein
MARWRIAVLAVVVAGFAGFVGFVSTPTANSDAWSVISSAPDSTLATLVKTPQTVAAWAGSAFSSSSLFSLPGGYNTAAAGGVAGDLETAGVAAEITINPWLLIAAGGFLAFGAVSAYIAYQNGSQYDHWSSSSLGTNASGVLYLPRLVAVQSGQSVCIGESPSGGTVSWTASSDGYILEANTGSGWCSSSWGPVAWDGSSSHVWINGVSTGSVSEATVAQDHGLANIDVEAKLQFMSADAQIWFLATPLGSAPPGFHLDNVTTTSLSTTLNCSGTGFDGFGCTGSSFNTATPTDAQLADALRNVLSTDSPSQNIVACYITGTCPSTAIAPYFSMPDCYGFTNSDCESAMEGLGFTGTLNEDEADVPDYTQPAGVVIATDPAESDPVSTASATTVTADDNPESCEWDVQNPHASSNQWFADAVDVKATATCTYATTIHATLTLWKCDEQPEPDYTSIEAGDWGCTYAAEATDVTRDAVPGEEEVFQAPDDSGGSLIPGDGYWFIAYGTLDVGTPDSMWSNPVQIQ